MSLKKQVITISKEFLLHSHVGLSLHVPSFFVSCKSLKILLAPYLQIEETKNDKI